ncbi:MAG: AlpA family phage regulatory protein [Gemmatimonadales bacterium]|nr:AlpA family phage regulatory protein [Gemmatimonadales bacterium]
MVRSITLVLARTGLSRSTIYVRLDQGLFPRPVSLGARAVGWLESRPPGWNPRRPDQGLHLLPVNVSSCASHASNTESSGTHRSVW